MADCISRDYALHNIECGPWDTETDRNRAIHYVRELTPAADVRPVPEGGIGEMSDGYHTFNGLYYQRMVLFAALVKAHKDKAWKSLRHEDGELCFGGGWFIVGIDTPQGSYTYHYEDKDWSWFDCVELPVAKHWDGHTEEDVTRLLSLDVRPVVHGEWRNAHPSSPLLDGGGPPYCSVCGKEAPLRSVEVNQWKLERGSLSGPEVVYKTECFLSNFCPNCGADMREVKPNGES